MTWDHYSHGTSGFALGFLIALVPLVAVLGRRRAPARAWLAAPLVALVALLAAEAIAGIVGRLLALSSLPTASLTIALVAAAGYGGGRMLASRRASTPDVHRRGAVILESTSGAALPGAISLAGVPIPANDEARHFKLIGTTGTGKSTGIRELLAGALARGDRAVIADPDGGYLARFHRPERGDRILNPFDERSAAWDLFGEIEAPHDIEHLARSLLPEGPDASGAEWRSYARTLLAAVLQFLRTEGPATLEELWRLMVAADAAELREKLAGTAAQPFFGEGAARMLQSIRGTATPALTTLKYAKGGGGTPLAVRQWVRTGTGVIFMPYRAGEVAALRGLIATWLRLAIIEALNAGERDQRLWFVVDELDALGQIDGLKDALARLRKAGGRCILGFQSIAQVRGTYGDAEAQTIVENCGNTLILRCSASERGGTAEFAARLIGRREVLRTQVAESGPAGRAMQAPRTRTQSVHHVVEDAVLPSEIEQLPDLAGFLKLASGAEWRSVRLGRA